MRYLLSRTWVGLSPPLSLLTPAEVARSSPDRRQPSVVSVVSHFVVKAASQLS